MGNAKIRKSRVVSSTVLLGKRPRNKETNGAFKEVWIGTGCCPWEDERRGGSFNQGNSGFEFCFYPRQSFLERLIKGKGFFF